MQRIVVVIGLPTDRRHAHLVDELTTRCGCPVVVVEADGVATELTVV